MCVTERWRWGVLQSLSVSIDQCLAERLVLRNGLENGAFLCDVADGPLPKPSATQTEDITARTEWYQEHNVNNPGPWDPHVQVASDWPTGHLTESTRK